MRDPMRLALEILKNQGCDGEHQAKHACSGHGQSSGNCYLPKVSAMHKEAWLEWATGDWTEGDGRRPLTVSEPFPEYLGKTAEVMFYCFEAACGLYWQKHKCHGWIRFFFV